MIIGTWPYGPRWSETIPVGAGDGTTSIPVAVYRHDIAPLLAKIAELEARIATLEAREKP